MTKISDDDLVRLLENTKHLSPEQQREVLRLIQRREKLVDLQAARDHFLPFVKAVWPSFIPGHHHTIMAEAFEKVASGEWTRLIINMAPRHTKSELASWLLPAWFLGKYPHKKIIQASNTEALAAGFGRRVRNLISGLGEEAEEGENPMYQQIFPNVRLAADSQAAAGWHTNKRGEYFAIGVNGKVTGKGGDIVIIDDPHSEQEAKQAFSRPEVFDDVYEWYTSGPRQRLQPGGAIIIVMCMTGDTDVLMATGHTVKLRDIRAGDEVATYEDGELTTSRIANWRSSGVDAVYTVQTQSGNIVRANERHPFLVEHEGRREWVRLQDLKPGMAFVSLKDVAAQLETDPGQGCVRPASQRPAITENIPMRRIGQWVSMARGEVHSAHSAALAPIMPEASAPPATGSSTHHQNTRRLKFGRDALSTATGLHRLAMIVWSKFKVASVRSATSRLAEPTPGRTGTESSALIMTMTRAWFAGCYATIATWLSATGKAPPSYAQLLITYSVIADPIVSITPDGHEEVFDVEVERTENFIANGVVSHNTRWSKRDLTGQVLKKEAERKTGEPGDSWKVINLPAILDEHTERERAIWPAFWPLATQQATRAELPVAKWKAQYQQQPTSEEGAIIKRETWRRWGADGEKMPGPGVARAWLNREPPPLKYVIQSWDTANTKTERADYCACTTWGVFEAEDPDTGLTLNHVILLNAYKERMEFPRLKKLAKRFYIEDEPDTLLVEYKGSGIQLVQEFRAMGVPVEANNFGRGTKLVSNDKVARANMVADVFASGYVWAPENRSSDEVIEECAEFPNGDFDDYVDSTVQAMLRFRTGGFLTTANDVIDDDDDDSDDVRSGERAYY